MTSSDRLSVPVMVTELLLQFLLFMAMFGVFFTTPVSLTGLFGLTFDDALWVWGGGFLLLSLGYFRVAQVVSPLEDAFPHLQQIQFGLTALGALLFCFGLLRICIWYAAVLLSLRNFTP